MEVCGFCFGKTLTQSHISKFKSKTLNTQNRTALELHLELSGPNRHGEQLA